MAFRPIQLVTDFITKLRDDQIVLLTALVSAAMLAGAHSFERFGNMPPCPLCLEQRETYWAAIFFALIAIGLWRWAKTKETAWPYLPSAAIVASLTYGAYLAGYHAGIEQKWWPGPTSCTASGNQLSIEEMLAQTDMQVVLCDKIPWSLFGISMAGYNFLIGCGLTLFAAIPLYRFLKERRS